MQWPDAQFDEQTTLAEPTFTEQPAFGLLPESEKRGWAFGFSTVVNGFALVLFIVSSLVHLPHEKARPSESVALTFEAPAPKPPRLKVPHIRLVAPHIKTVARVATAKLSQPATPAASVPLPRQFSVGVFNTPRPTVVANNRPAALVKVGAFGNPMGARPSTNPTVGRVQAPLLGTFGGVAGASGVGSGRSGGLGGVRSTSFGAGATAGGGGGLPQRQLAQNDTQPVTVIHGVRPQYTAEARAARVEGDVTLRVCFTANRRVEVLGLVHSLGHGLDESAENAVRQYQFEPATRNGRPVDQTTTVHVRFQLAA